LAGFVGILIMLSGHLSLSERKKITSPTGNAPSRPFTQASISVELSVAIILSEIPVDALTPRSLFRRFRM
ncbi:hypothetical protein, partial [Pantoea piersonii]|uniref:hypothetical protein n=1 Tax=Pantoea piersonii TaxID=2364647 RepID=UPI00289CB313